MAILTEQIWANNINLDDLVHIARADQVQSDNGSSYKATIAQLIDANGCCLDSGIFSENAGTIDFYGISGDLSFTVDNVYAFTGGSNSCINNLYLNNIHPCVQHVFIQPQADGDVNKSTFFGVSGTYTQMNISHTESTYGPVFPLTKWGINNQTINNRSTFQFFAPDGDSDFRYYDNLYGAASAQNPGGLFADLQEIVMVSSNSTTSTALKVVSESGAGLVMGSIDPTTVLPSVEPFGVASDTFLAKVGPSNGLNIVSTNETNTSGFIAFFLNGDYENKSGQPEIFINGSSPTKGFMGIGKNNITPTSLIDISGTGGAVGAGTLGYRQLRLRTKYGPPNTQDSGPGAAPTGTICWDDDGIYVKVNPVIWRKFLLSSF
jgi:hypothetical protein